MLNITQAVTRAFRQTFNFQGRARRSEYWWTWLFLLVLVLACGFIDDALIPTMSDADAEIGEGAGYKSWLLNWKYLPLSTGVYYLTLPTLLAVTARRMHDVNKPAWIGMLPILAMEIMMFIRFEDLIVVLESGQIAPSFRLIAFIGLFCLTAFFGLYTLFLCIRDGDQFDNQYGPSPKYGNELDVFD